MTTLRVRPWSVEEWVGSETAWDALLASSGADALFMSWDWLTRWWRQYSVKLGLSARILAFYDGDRLVGLAPFYERRVVRGRFVGTRSLQQMGVAWRDPAPLISEYLDVLAAPEYRDAVRLECLRRLLDQADWNELVVGFTPAGEEWRDAFARAAPGNGHYARVTDRSVSYHADLSQGFAPYLRDLGQSSRRSVWNLRRRLSDEFGETRLEFVASGEIDAAFDDLNRLHHLRWNRPAFPGERLDFHKSFASGLAARGELVFTRLRVAGNVVSVLYDIRKGARQYNMKMGFDPHFTTRLSLGLVHFGYALEAAAERGVAVYDFLAGPGQHFDFKRNLGQLRCDLSSVHMVRGWCLSTLYRWYDRMRPA